MRDGVVFSLPHPLEYEVSEKLVELIPSAEMVRFAKNGSDATAGAVRAARAFTGRDIIACCGYHGWQDWFIGSTTRNAGVPRSTRQLTLPFEYNQMESLERIFDDHPGQVAAIIMEPVGIVEPQGNFLQKVRALASREGAVLIFDEVITGFRYAIGGAQELYGVTPDLSCCGKAMGNGFPISAVVGRRDIMEIFDEIFFSFTFGGETLSLAAAKATIIEMQQHNVIGHLWSTGQRLRDGFNVLAKEFEVADRIACIGLGPRTSTSFTDGDGLPSLELKSLFQQENLKRGVLFSGAHNLCYSHSDADIERTLHVYRTAMEICAVALKEGDIIGRLEGPTIQPVFRHA
jgi:glutamate-1-semialdehyde 2,1-aminomutase/spore coat polysaccharide biosynthesis protein SpsF